MGTDYHASLGVGFLISRAEMHRVLGVTILKPTENIDDPEWQLGGFRLDGVTYEIHGSRIEDPDGDTYGEFQEKLGQKFGCSVSVTNIGYDDTENCSFAFEPIPGPKYEDGFDITGRFSLSGGTTYASMCSKQVAAQLKALKKKLEDFGFRPGEPTIFVSGNCG